MLATTPSSHAHSPSPSHTHTHHLPLCSLPSSLCPLAPSPLPSRVSHVLPLSAAVRYYPSHSDSSSSPPAPDWAETGGFHSGEVITAQCAAGHHFEPPLEELQAKLTCSANSLWVDAQLGGVRRCVRDRADCPTPLVDAGYAECVDPAPQVTSIEVVTAQWSPLFMQVNRDPATVVDILPIYHDYTRANQLLIRGRWLTAPVSVTVGARACYNPQVRNVSLCCWWPSPDAAEVVCREFGESIMCTLVDDLGVSQKVIVVTGRGSRRRTISSLTLNPGPRGDTSLTLSATEPVIGSLAPPRGAADAPLCLQPNGVTLTECPISEAFRVSICATGASLSGQYSGSQQFEPTRTQSEPTVLADTSALTCDGWRYDYSDQTECGLEIYWCVRVQVCASCWVEPVVGRSLTLSIVYNITATESITNAKQNSQRSTAATISFAGCPNGTWTNYTAQYTQRCVQCRPGESTMGLPEQQRCTPCKPGYHALEPGSADCVECEAGTYSASSGQASCDACTGNAWQLFGGQSRCSKCEQAKYKVQGLDVAPTSSTSSNGSTSSSSSTTSPLTLSCEACPAGAQCMEDGSIVAGPGSFLMLDARTGVVSSVDCLWTACVAGSAACLASRQVAAWSGVSVANCCGQNRRPAVDALGVVNALCAQCEDGYTEMQGQCVECRSTRWDRLLGILLLLFLLVYLLHRLSQRSPSAQLSIFFYSSQMSLLFLSSEPIPYVFGLLNMDLLGNPATSSSVDIFPSGCVLPVNDYGKIGVRLLSPLVAILLLGLLCLIQLGCRALVHRHGVSPSLMLAYRVILSSRAPSMLPWTGDEVPARDRQAAPTHLELASATPPLGQPLLGEDEKRFGDSDSSDLGSGHSVPPLLSPASSASTLSSEGEEAIVARPMLMREGWPSVLLEYESTAVRLVLFSYNALATVCLAFFHTRAIDGLGRRLWSYPAIDTSSAAYMGLVPLLGLLLVVVVFGGPVALLVYLAWLRRTGRIGKELVAPPSDVDRSDGQAASVDEVVPAAMTATVLPGALMTATFRPRFWFMSVLIMSRRLALIACLTFVAQPQAYTWLTLLNCAIALLHALTWPYRLERDNWVETFALSVLVVQTTLLTLYPAFQSRPMAASVALWALLALPGVLMLVIGLMRFTRRRRAERVG